MSEDDMKPDAADDLPLLDIESHFGDIDPASVVALLRRFEERESRDLAMLQMARQAHCFDEMVLAAHSLTGSAMAIGAVRLAHYAAAIENDAKNGRQVSLEKLETTFSQTVQAIRTWRSRRG